MYGSVVNRLMESSAYPTIEVGMGVTFCHWSDRSPGTVVAIRYAADGTTVREVDIAGDLHGPNLAVWPAQRYEITPTDPATVKRDGISVQTWRMDRHGRLRKTYISDSGRRVMAPRQGGPGLRLGSRDYYQDPSF
jgi:diadenosine tetraphosphatase ApaH/serine/threonine PP2A family protein phosphatase